jgi:RimJ/RimL family protein N-acetyltransferase
MPKRARQTEGNRLLRRLLPPRLRGSSLENAMMERILESAKRERVHKVNAGVVAEDEDTISILERFGFDTEGRKIDDFFGRGGRTHNVLSMRARAYYKRDSLCAQYS